MGLKIILFVYFWLYCCITNLNLWQTIFWTNYLLLLNENLLNFTIGRDTKLEGAISGPDRVLILQAGSGRAFHYWSGARQITLSGPHFSRSASHQNFCTGNSLSPKAETFLWVWPGSDRGTKIGNETAA